MKKASPVSEKFVPLTDDEIIQFSKSIKKGDAASKELEELEENGMNDVSPSRLRNLKSTAKKGKQASDKFTQANMGLVVYLARRYKGWGLSEQDLIQEGCLALVQAVHRFDPSKGARFSTYATQWIDPVMRRAAGAQTRVLKMSAAQVAKQAALSKALIKLEEENQAFPTAEELSKELKMDIKEVQELLKTRSVQFTSKSLDGEEGEAYNYADEHENIEEALVNADVMNQFASELGSALDDLGELEREIITMRFGLDSKVPMSLDDVAKEIQKRNGKQVTKEKIRSIEERAISHLRIQTQRQFRHKGKDLEAEVKDLF